MIPLSRRVKLDSGFNVMAVYVCGKVSSEVTKVPLAESRRLIVMESKLSESMERKEGKTTVKCRER